MISKNWFQPVPLNSNGNNSHGSRENSPEVMEGHQSSSQRSSPTDADHLQRITALTVNVGKISKSHSIQSSSANQRSAQNTTNSAPDGGSSDPILAMEKLVKSRIPNSSTSRSWKMSHWLWIIVLVQISKVIWCF